MRVSQPLDRSQYCFKIIYVEFVTKQNENIYIYIYIYIYNLLGCLSLAWMLNPVFIGEL
jgi:hypothetical protein